MMCEYTWVPYVHLSRINGAYARSQRGQFACIVNHDEFAVINHAFRPISFPPTSYRLFPLALLNFFSLFWFSFHDNIGNMKFTRLTLKKTTLNFTIYEKELYIHIHMYCLMTFYPWSNVFLSAYTIFIYSN